MIHKKIVKQKIKEFEIQEFVKDNLKGVGLSGTKLQITPLGEKIIISASRPGLIVGRKGQSIKKLTLQLKNNFGLDNPQIEIDEVKDMRQDANIVSETIATYLERFGAGRFKSIGHKCLEDAISSGAYGIEIKISGKVPSSRAKVWRFYKGYLKKCGDLSSSGVHKSYTTAHLKTGAIGIQVRIMPGNIRLPDDIKVFDELVTIQEEVDVKKVADNKAVKKTIKKKTTKKKTAKKSVTKKKTVQKSAEEKPAEDKSSEKKE